nr:KUP/HAK/KT family potassium transporter [Cupriavidus sp. AcVe19-6a]
MPISVGVLIALCLVLRHSTAMIWAFLGPIMLLWFLALARSSIHGIIRCACAVAYCAARAFRMSAGRWQSRMVCRQHARYAVGRPQQYAA